MVAELRERRQGVVLTEDYRRGKYGWSWIWLRQEWRAMIRCMSRDIASVEE